MSILSHSWNNQLICRDSGVKAVLKDIHNKIRNLEADLTDMHKKMAAEPEKGIAVLMDRTGKTGRITSDEDAKAWFDLIGKHKEWVHSRIDH